MSGRSWRAKGGLQMTAYGYSARPDGRGGVTLTPSRDLQRVIDRTLRRRTRDADPDPLDPGTPGSDEYLGHDDFLPNGRQPPDRLASTVRTTLFHHPGPPPG